MTDSKNCTIAGRLNIPSIVNHFGEGSFNHPLLSPWETLLSESSPSNNLANGLSHAWSHLTTKFQEVTTNEQSTDVTLLLMQDVSRVGCYSDGTVAPSVTKAITMELEQARSNHVGIQITNTLGRQEYERWSWEAWTKMSPTFLLSPPDHFGFLADPHFQIAIANYLGQPCPMMAPVVGRFFGKKGVALDKRFAFRTDGEKSSSKDFFRPSTMPFRRNTQTKCKNKKPPRMNINTNCFTII